MFCSNPVAHYLQCINAYEALFLELSSKIFGKFFGKIYEKLLEELSSMVGILFLLVLFILVKRR